MRTMFYSCCLIIISGCSSVANFSGAQESADIWDKMRECAERAQQNVLKADCSRHFQNVRLDLQLDSVSSINDASIMVIANFGNPLKTFSCALGKKYKNKASTLSPGDVIAVRGTLSSVTNFSKNSQDFHLDPCELIR